jgi:hypothetical protein
MAWQEVQEQNLSTLNERMMDKYGKIFDDPSRVPTFDQKSRLWEVSSKFKIEDNDDPDFTDDFRHPFLEKYY